jgi:hypothetical protein
MAKIITREILLDWKGEETEATKQENEEPIFRVISESNKNQNRVLSQTKALHVDGFLTRAHLNWRVFTNTHMEIFSRKKKKKRWESEKFGDTETWVLRKRAREQLVLFFSWVEAG